MPRWPARRFGARSNYGARRGSRAAARRPYNRQFPKRPDRQMITSKMFQFPRSVNFYQGMPRRVSMKMKYSANFLLSPTTTVTRQVFRANGLFDPDFTGTGHQPYYFDEMAALYNSYVVTGCNVEARFVAQQANPTEATVLNANIGMRWLLDLSADSGLDISQLGERPDCIIKQLSATTTPVIKMYRSTAEIAGVAPFVVLTDPTFASTVGADPTSIFGVEIMAQNIAESSTAADVCVYVILTYYAQFFDLKTTAQS